MTSAPPGDPRPTSWLNRTVLGAGVTSALGDFCYETTTVILPGFLAVLGLPAALLGLIEGVADAVASFTKMVSGYVADRLGHRKRLVLIGYALTPAGQALFALAAGWPLLLLGRIVSWFGKGLRGPLRDAIVTQAVTPETRGRAFGFHRATDTLGAVAGPLLGVALLGWAQALPWDGALWGAEDGRVGVRVRARAARSRRSSGGRALAASRRAFPRNLHADPARPPAAGVPRPLLHRGGAFGKLRDRAADRGGAAPAARANSALNG